MGSLDLQRPIIAATRRVRQALERMGIQGDLVLSHVDGAPLSEAEVAACVRVIAELDAEEVSAIGVARLSR